MNAAKILRHRAELVVCIAPIFLTVVAGVPARVVKMRKDLMR